MSSSIWTFNTKDGYAEAIVRGLRQSLLTPDEYRRLGLADNLDDLRTALEDTDYGNFLQDEPSPLSVPTIGLKCRAKLAAEFRHLRSLANQPLIRFLDFIAAEKMIDNVVSLIQGAANKKSTEELLSRVDPLGYFPEMRAVAALDLSSGYEDLYRMLLVDTPVGLYFEAYLNAQETAKADHHGGEAISSMFTEQDMEIMRSSLKKAWLEDFYQFCTTQGGATGRIMGHMLSCEADFRVMSVTLNTINTQLGSSTSLQERNALYPSFGYLYPDGIDKIRKAWNDPTLRSALEPFPKYIALYEQCKAYYVRDDVATSGANDKAVSLEDLLFQEYVTLSEMAFEEQFHYGVFYAWVKLKEQEIRNIVWIADMVLMKRKDQVDKILPLFAPRS